MESTANSCVAVAPVAWRWMDAVATREAEDPTEIDAPTLSGGTSSWLQLHPRLGDLMLVLAIFAYNLPIQFGAVPGHLWLGTGLLVSVGLCVPGLWRRQWPVATYLALRRRRWVVVLEFGRAW